MDVFTIFNRPADYPDVPFVVRRFRIAEIDGGYVAVPEEIVGTADTLDDARTLIPRWASARVQPAALDDATVTESWL